MKKIFAIIILLLFFVLLWFTKQRHDFCCDSKVVVEKQEEEQITPTIEVIKPSPPLLYSWGRSEAITNEFWEAKKNEILEGKEAGKILQISAPYFKAEGVEIGVLRAKQALKKLGQTETQNVRFIAKLIPFYEEARTANFEGTDFHWLTNNENVQEMNGKTVIYFTSNSSKKISNENILTYLKQVATSLKNKTIVLTGHSDSKGAKSRNKNLALKRAKTIKRELIQLGVNKENITTISFGEEKPIADNKTASGRQKNRRVELEIK